MIVNSTFKPAWWLKNPHAQTICSSLLPPPDFALGTRIEQVELPDGDFIDLFWSESDLAMDAPLVVILHGLGGGINSSYVPRFMNAFNNKGWRAVLMLFRGAGTKPNRLPRAYHSGDTADLNFLIQLINKKEPATKKGIVGISLGGNVLLKWLGEQGSECMINAAVAVSVPFVLKDVANHMSQGFSRLYQAHLLRQLKILFAEKSRLFSIPPEAFKQAAYCRCLWTFDHHVTAPLYGFSSAHSYYRESSSRQYLSAIRVPTLIIHSEDDPFMSSAVLPKENELSSSTILELSKTGGHVGFISGTTLGRPVYWLDKRIPEYFEALFSPQ